MLPKLSAALCLLLLVCGTCQVLSPYKIASSFTDSKRSFYTAALDYTGNETHYINQTNKVIQHLNFTYFFTSPEHLVIKITDRESQRWEVPNEAPFPHRDSTKKFKPYDDALVSIAITEEPFSFKITRKNTGEVVFDSSVGDFIYTDYYLQISTSLATPNIYGFGERVSKLNLGPDGTYSMWNQGTAGLVDNGTIGHQTYGYHPVYLLREQSDNFSMALLRSSVPMAVQIEGGKKLTYKVVGGILDFQFFLGDEEDSEPETVVKQYHEYLGGWTLQPFWSFGFHQCRWGYHNMSELDWVLGNYSANNLPLDVMWSDIDYMEKYIDFTIDAVNYPADKMKKMIKQYKKRWVPIIDAGIAVNNSMAQVGIDSDVYLKNPNGTNVVGVVWPERAYFPDFMHPNTTKFWHYGLNELYKQIPFDGIWLDMNEVATFSEGEPGFVNDPSNILNNPPYKPTQPHEQIYSGTARLDAVHHGNISEFYLHNTFAFLEAKATYNYLKKRDEQVFILTRSSFYGSGKYTAHWTGDNIASYQFMQLSVPGIMNFGLFGIPFTGSDICGFTNDTTPELCARWFQLGTLYPFSRDHNAKVEIPQEPYALGPTVLQTARVTLNFRYSILKHYYAEFIKQKGTGTIFRPLFFEFPSDKNLYDSKFNYTDNQFLIGDSLLAAPALEQNQTEVEAYFPKDTWFDFITGKLMKTHKQEAGTVRCPTPFNTTAPIFIRGGHIIPTQNTNGVNRSDDLSNKYQLHIAFKESHREGVQKAHGHLWEDNTADKCRNGKCLYNVKAKIELLRDHYDLTVSFTSEGKMRTYQPAEIESLVIMGDFGGDGTNSLLLDQEVIVEGARRHVKVEVIAENVVKYIFNKPIKVRPDSDIMITSKKEVELRED